MWHFIAPWPAVVSLRLRVSKSLQSEHFQKADMLGWKEASALMELPIRQHA